MATLTQIYGNIKQVCFKDDSGVYLSGEKVALDNASNNGYIRRAGPRRIVERLGACDGVHAVELPLIFVGAAPKADPLLLETATLAALVGSDIEIISSEIDKGVIAESEGIALEDLTRFDGVAMVLVEYNQATTEIYDPKCDVDIC